ncbi:AI-2E family transporter [Sphingobium sp. CR28]|uniref:AI-2E family transporter n=1 Tax=Sphingobium sp. CR28 TaxID=3400272 RepID=UPI003FEF2BF8
MAGLKKDSGPGLQLEQRFLLLLLLALSVAFALLIRPFFAAVLWAVIAAILFVPVNRRLLRRMPGRTNLAALLTLLLIVAMVIVPALLLSVALLEEAMDYYSQLQAGQIDVARLFAQFQAGLPSWALDILRRLGLTDLKAVAEQIETGLASSVRTLAGQLLLIGQSTLGFIASLGVMLYLTFFLLRDGERLSARLFEAMPLQPAPRDALARQFVLMIRATIKGSLVVAILQGLIGGIVFWFIGINGAMLWGILMGAFSLLPAVGTGIVWVPVAIYLFATGAIWQGLALVFCGIFVIGMVDNVVRPILVGRDTRIPDYVVLISTLGGLDLFGFNGIIIGPVIAALFIAIWNIVTSLRQDEASA